ncbi:MAG: BtpA/SgcQ family protein [Bdellovibrionales bacterium]
MQRPVCLCLALAIGLSTAPAFAARAKKPKAPPAQPIAQDVCEPALATAATSNGAPSEVSLIADSVDRMANFKKLFGTSKPIIAMVHLAGKDTWDILKRVEEELDIFVRQGVEAVIVENYHSKDVNVMHLALHLFVKRYPQLVFGVNVLPNEIEVAYEMAAAHGAKFIQFDHVAGTYMGFGYSGATRKADRKKLEEMRKKYPQIQILGGVHPKYYDPVPGSDLGKDLRRGVRRSDAIVVTGTGTGIATPLDKIKIFRQEIGAKVPLVVGAGVDIQNVRSQLAIADGVIIGSYFKGGETFNKTDEGLVAGFMKVVREIRDQNP